MPRPKKRWPWVALALVGLAIILLGIHKARGPQVPIVTATKKPLVHRIVATGRVMPPARAHLGSTILAKAVTVTAQQGDPVKAGDLLIQLDDAEAKAAVAQARASVAQAEAKLRVVRQVTSRLATEGLNQATSNLEQADRQLQRIEALAKSGAVPQEQLDDARRAYDNAKSQHTNATTQLQSTGPSGSDFLVSSTAVSQAMAGLQGALARLDQTRIVSPVDGIVLTRSVEPGDVVQPGKVLMILAREGDTQLVVTPDEKSLAFLRLGQTAIASADAFPGERFEAKVITIAPGVDPDRGTVEVKLRVDKPPAYLRADMTVSVDIEVGRREDALVLPVDAVRDPTGDHPWILVVEGSRASRRSIKAGIRTEGLIEIQGGMQPGELVIPVSAGPVTPGSRVRPKPVIEEIPGAV
ncbi:MAG: efflux RND transporter periplasmic adaptor subunit [Deltaproteobacteria bacterium]|nr:efflux RND transporter periplasmic adaptor subunit [Deltaproteobacteria bacterium]